MKNAPRTNKYAGTCACGTKVAAEAGTLGPKVAGKWTTRCWTCVTAENVAKARSAQWRYPTTPAAPARRYNDDDGYDARKDAACVAGTWTNRRYVG